MKKSELDLDSILDQALDDFEEIEYAENAKKVLNRGVTKSTDQNNQLKNVKSNNETGNVERVQKVMNDVNHPTYGDAVQTTLRDLSGISEGINTVNDLFDKTAGDNNLDSKSTAENGDDVPDDGDTADREVAATLKMIADAQKGMEGFEANKLEEVGETMMEDMMQQFEALGEKEDYNEVIDGVMRQLLSKDLMYEPTKQICNKFPEWLANNKQNLSELEYNNYGKMYQTFQRLLATYDTEPDNFSRLMELMFDMQQYGQPPAEIIKDLAPGLKFDENGMPIMPNMGAGMMPGMAMPGGEGLPDMANMAAGMANGQCSIQ